MFMKMFLSEKICLTLVIIQKTQIFLIILIKKLLVEWKSGGIIIDEFVGLRSKMYSIKKIDGKESSTAKGVNTATECNEF